MDLPIQFHEDEYLNATVTDDTLRLVAVFCGKETADKLLYGNEEPVSIHTELASIAM